MSKAVRPRDWPTANRFNTISQRIATRGRRAAGQDRRIGEPKIEVEANSMITALIRRGVDIPCFPIVECAIC
jgi:hypothetical protein